MRTKEEILMKNFIKEFGFGGHGDFNPYIPISMDEYAKEVLEELSRRILETFGFTCTEISKSKLIPIVDKFAKSLEPKLESKIVLRDHKDMSLSELKLESNELWQYIYLTRVTGTYDQFNWNDLDYWNAERRYHQISNMIKLKSLQALDVDNSNEEEVEEDINFFPKTKQFLEKEIGELKQARDGVGKAFNLLKRDGIEDEHLRELYNAFDSKLKEFNLSIDALRSESLRNCASC